MKKIIHSPGVLFVFPTSVATYAAIFIVSSSTDHLHHFVMIDKDGFPHLYVLTLTDTLHNHFEGAGGQIIEP
jgi:hypothetical protein